MKTALRGILINSVAIAVAAVFLPAIDYNQQLGTLIFAATMLGIGNTFIKPVLQLIMLPINVITLGIAGLFTNTILLFLVTLLVPNFNIIPYDTAWGTTTIHVNLIGAYIITSIVLSILTGLLRKIVEK